MCQILGKSLFILAGDFFRSFIFLDWDLSFNLNFVVIMYLICLINKGEFQKANELSFRENQAIYRSEEQNSHRCLHSIESKQTERSKHTGYLKYQLVVSYLFIWNHNQHVLRLFSLMVTSYCLGRRMAN